MSQSRLQTLFLHAIVAAIALLSKGCDPAPFTWEDSEHTFALTCPASWEIETRTPLVLLTGDGAGSTIPSKVIALRSAAPRGLSTTSFEAIQNGFLRGLADKQIENALVESASDSTFAGESARRAIITGHSARLGSDVKVVAMFCLHDGAIYTLGGIAAPERFEKVRDDMDAVAKTFRLKGSK